MTSTWESSPGTSPAYPGEVFTNGEITKWLEGIPTYNGTLRVFNGDFSAHDFVKTMGNSTKYTVIDSADGSHSIVQGGLDSADKSKRSDYFDYHTDGFYHDKPPDLFVLACENPGETDIRTAFVDSKEALRKVERYMPILERLQFVYIGKDLKRYSRPLIERHPIDGLPITNLVTRGYVEPDVDESSIAALPDYRFINEAMAALYAAIGDTVGYVHSWQQGDALVADNHTFLHARLAGTPDTSRRLSRIWLNHTVEIV